MNKAKAAHQTIIAVAGNRNFNCIELEAIWGIIERCIVNIITYDRNISSYGLA